jgi:hypothetical protein
MDIDHLHSQLVQCTSSFMQLLKLLEHEQGEDSRAIFIQGKSNISKAILQLNMLLGKPDSWMVGGVCRVRRADGGLDVALVVEILQGVLATDHDNDNDESSTTVARLCWLRPRNIYELSSRGFLVGLNDLIHFYDSDLFDSERKRIKESTKVWALVSSSSGYLELMHVTQSSPTHTYVMRPKGDDEWMLDSGEYLVLCPCVGSHTPPLATAVAEEADELEVIKPEDIFPRRSLTVGAWEQHTKGFGSKMLTRMGYKRYDADEDEEEVVVVLIGLNNVIAEAKDSDPKGMASPHQWRQVRSRSRARASASLRPSPSPRICSLLHPPDQQVIIKNPLEHLPKRRFFSLMSIYARSRQLGSVFVHEQQA